MREVAADWRVEPNLTGLDLPQDRGSGESLADATYAVPHVRGNGTAGADVGNAGGAAPHQVAGAHLGEHSRNPRPMDLVYGGRQLRGVEWVLHTTRPLVFSTFWNRHRASFVFRTP